MGHGAVATSQPLATLAGMEMLGLVETLWMLPSDGDHPDCSRTHLKRYRCGRLALVWDGKLHGLNASGEAPAPTPELFAAMERVPSLGWSVTVPERCCLWGAGSCPEQL